jgi:hypothetical protein
MFRKTTERSRVAALTVAILAGLAFAAPAAAQLDPNASAAYPNAGYGIIICGNSIVFNDPAMDQYIKQLLLESYRAFRYNLGFDPNNLWVLVDSGDDSWTQGEFDALPATQTQVANTFTTIGQRMWNRPDVPRNLVVVIGGHGARGLSGVATSMRVQLSSGLVWDYAFVSNCLNKINNNSHSGSPIERLDMIMTMCYGGGLIDDCRSNFNSLRGTTWPNAKHFSALTAGDGFDITSGLFGVYMVQAMRGDGAGVPDLNGDGVLSIYEYFDHAARVDITNPTVPYTPYIPQTIYVPSNSYIPIPYGTGYIAEHPLYYEWNAPVSLNASWRLSGQGHVDLNPEPNDANAPQYPYGMRVTLTAVPVDGRIFKNWELYDPNHPDDGNYMVTDANNPISIFLNGDRQVMAVFGCSSGVEQALPLMGIGGLMGLFVSRRARRRR